MGTEITGTRANAGIKLSSTWGTATAIGQNDALEASITDAENAETLMSPTIGTGEIGPVDIQRGPTSPSWHIETVPTYDCQANIIPKQFFGAQSIVAYAAAGAYCHSYVMQEYLNNSYITLAYEKTTQSLIEYPTAVITKLGYSAKVGDYVRMTADALADMQKLTSQTNSIALLDAATIPDSTRIVCDAADEFLINAQSGAALASPTDRVNISSFAVEYSKEHEHVRECKGSLGNSVPVSSGNPPLNWTVTIEIPRPQDSTWIYAAQQGYEYKASFSCTGPLISGSVYKKITWNFPRLKVISDVKWDLANSGINPLTVVFQGLVAASAPQGMIAFDKYPSITEVNTRATWGV